MWNIIEFEELASTNTLASEMLARSEARHGDVMQAWHQTGGHGRSAGRMWNDEAGASLLMSLVLTKIPEPANLLQYRVALAVIAALRNIGEIDGTSKKNFRLKWPNDLLLEGKKVCGILLEAQWNASQMRSAIIGIGINVKQSSFPEELDAIATSLRLCGLELEVNDVRYAVLEQLRLEIEENNSILTRLRDELEWMTKLPSLEWIGSDGTSISNLCYEDINDSGALRLRLTDGSTIIRHSGSLVLNA
jgi:BirA family transcriptional regulator, biotin operon repressor / biotin---[acetyl-CoA-carboxylase] ligase